MVRIFRKLVYGFKAAFISRLIFRKRERHQQTDEANARKIIIACRQWRLGLYTPLRAGRDCRGLEFPQRCERNIAGPSGPLRGNFKRFEISTEAFQCHMNSGYPYQVNGTLLSPTCHAPSLVFARLHLSTPAHCEVSRDRDPAHTLSGL